MKKQLIGLSLILLCGLYANAQTERGSWMVGGNLDLNTAKNQTVISVVPSAGYFFLRNFVAGANAEVSYSKDIDVKNTTLGLGPFVRYYLGTMNIRPFGDAELNLGTTKTKTPVASNTFNSNSFFLGAGLAGFINRNVAIEGLAGYKHTKFAGGPSTGGFNLRIGFQVYLSHEQVQKLRR